MSGSVQAQAHRLVGEVERQLHPLEIRQALAYWRQATEGSEATRKEYAQARAKLRDFLSQKELLAEVVALRDEVDRKEDEYTKRQLDILYSLLLPHQQNEELVARQDELVAEIEAIDAAYRTQLDEQVHNLAALDGVPFSNLDPTLGQASFEASKAVGVEVAPLLLQLVEARNEGARSAGFDDFYSLALAARELREDALFSLLAEVEQALSTLSPRDQAELSDGLELDSIFDDEDLVGLATDYFDALGLRVANVISRSDLLDHSGKGEGSFCLDVDSSGDVRIRCSLRPPERGIRTLFHLLGQAVYHLNIAKEFPYLLRRPAHGLTAKAASYLFERMVYDEAWLGQWAGVSAQEARQIALKANFRNRAGQAALVRSGLVVVHFERALYREPQAGFNDLWWHLIEKFLGASRPEGWDVPVWAAQVGLSVAPVTVQTRLLGEIAAAQLSDMVDEELGEGAMAVSPAAGYLLIDRWFAHGARFVWSELAEMAFGRPLGAEAYIARYFSG